MCPTYRLCLNRCVRSLLEGFGKIVHSKIILYALSLAISRRFEGADPEQSSQPGPACSNSDQPYGPERPRFATMVAHSAVVTFNCPRQSLRALHPHTVSKLHAVYSSFDLLKKSAKLSFFLHSLARTMGARRNPKP